MVSGKYLDEIEDLFESELPPEEEPWLNGEDWLTEEELQAEIEEGEVEDE